MRYFKQPHTCELSHIKKMIHHNNKRPQIRNSDNAVLFWKTLAHDIQLDITLMLITHSVWLKRDAQNTKGLSQWKRDLLFY